MEVEVAGRRGLVTLAGGALLLLAVLGLAITPQSRSGEPLLLSPTNLALFRYLRQSQQWLAELRALDGQLAAMLDDDTGDIYRLGRQAQAASRQAHDLAQAVERERSPAALTALQEALREAASRYDRAAERVLVYVGAPDGDTQQQAWQALLAAQEAFRQVSGRQEALWTGR